MSLLIETKNRKNTIAYLCYMNIPFEEKENYDAEHSLFII